MNNKVEKLLGGLRDLQHTRENFRYYKHISALQKFVHSRIPEEQFNTGKVPVPTDIRQENFQGRNHKRAVMYLMSNGCEWAKSSGHGCTMCGHLAKQTRTFEPITAEEYYSQFVSEFSRIDFKQFPLLNLYNNGSILNDNEMPPEARRNILTMVNRQPDIKMLVLETRPEYVTEEKLNEIKQILPDKHVEISIGLEMKDDFLRTICINKGFSLKQFDRAAELIVRHLNLRTYVLLKPAFLSEGEAVWEAIATIKHAFSVGAATVSLEACTIQDYTLVRFLADRELYKTPWLWSIREVVRSTAHLGKLVIGMFHFFPSPVEVPYNCPQCSHDVMDAFTQYNRLLDPAVLDSLNCSCKRDWEAEINEKLPPLEERLEELIGRLDLQSLVSQGDL